VPVHPDPGERAAVALPPLDARARQRAEDQGWDVDLLDPEDPDERSILIRLAHAKLDDAISEGRDEVTIDGWPINPRLHLTVHEIVATQIIDGDPPEAFATATRLLDSGREHHEVLHMLGWVVSEQIWAATHEQRISGRDEHVRALAALPGSYDELASPSRTPGSDRRHAHGARRRRR
jgi:hypothetical protein